MLIRPRTMTLAECILACIAFVKQSTANSNARAVQSMFTMAAKSITGKPPLLVDLLKRVGLGERPYNFCQGQMSRVLSYSARALSRAESDAFLASWPWPTGCNSPSAGDTSAPADSLDELADAPADDGAIPPASAPAGASAPDSALDNAYRTLPDPGASFQLYAVCFQQSGVGSSSAAGAGEPSEVDSAELVYADHGLPCKLEDTATTHICSALWCTCLTFRHWGLPCAHMFRAMFAESMTLIPHGVVHRRWLPSDIERGKSVARLRASAVRDGAFVHDLVHRKELSADERHENLMRAATVVASLGAISQQMYKVVMTKLVNIHAQARTGTLVPESSGLRQQAAAARMALAAAARAARSGASEGAPAGEADADADEDLLVLNRVGASDMGKRRRSAANISKEAGAKAAKKLKTKPIGVKPKGVQKAAKTKGGPKSN